MADEPSANAAAAALSSEIFGDEPVPLRKPLGDDAEQPVVISVIISTYNVREVLADCLASIYRDPPDEPYEIIVVDDASSDGTAEMVRARFPEVRLLINEVHLHYTRSNNRALDRARGEYIHLLNSDTIVLPRALDSLVAFLRNHPDAGAVGSKLLNEDGTLQWSAKSLPDLGSALFGGRGVMTHLFPTNRYTQRRFHFPDPKVSEPFVAGYLSGASKMMPRKVVDEIGHLDSDMFYHVDADYCKRIAEAGYQCYYLPDSVVMHLNHKGGSMGSPRLRVRSLLSFHVDCYVYYRKHMQRWAWSPMRFVILAALAANFVASLMVQFAAELVGAARSLSQQRRVAN